MRGAGNERGFEGKGLRITPADAGSRAALVPHPQMQQDHPRGCGEQEHVGYVKQPLYNIASK